MQFAIKKQLAFELAGFLRQSPQYFTVADKDGKPVKVDMDSYYRVQRVRLALEKAMGEYYKRAEEFGKEIQEEKKTYDNQQDTIMLEPEPDWVKNAPDAEKAAKLELWHIDIKRRAKVVNVAFNQMVAPKAEAFDKVQEKDDNQIIDVKVNEEDLRETKVFFKEFGTRDERWARLPDHFLDVSKCLDLFDPNHVDE